MEGLACNKQLGGDLGGATMLAVSARGRTEMELEETVDAATGQKAPKKPGKRKRKRLEVDEEKDSDMSGVECSPKRKRKTRKWLNKQRVLVFCARGVTFRARHLMTDVRALLPQSRADTKMDRKDKLPVINEICEMKNCTKCIFFEMRKKKDLYMWVSSVPHGPSAKFLVENVHTMDELKLTGNCLLGSRPLLSFDPMFSGVPHMDMLRELFTQVFSTPYCHPKSKPFIDHVFHFGLVDGKIWFRNYQIANDGTSLTEIGPRFVLNLIKIFEGSFGGATLYENPDYITPNAHRHLTRLSVAHKYKKRVDARRSLAERRQEQEGVMTSDPLEDMFKTTRT